MGVDWRTIGWREYQIRLVAWNAAHDTEKPKDDPDLDRLNRFTAAHATMQ